MKLAKNFLFWLAITAIAVTAFDLNILSGSELLTKQLERFVNKRLSADGYPVAVFTLLLLSSVMEFLLLLGFSFEWLSKLRGKAQQRIVKIGGGLLGGLMGLTASAYVKGNIDDAKLGVSVSLMVGLYVAAPLFMASVLHMLRDPDPNPKRTLLIQWVAAITYISIAAISTWGINKYIGA